MNYKIFGLIVKKERKKLGYSQSELADKIGVTRLTIWNIERGAYNTQFHIGMRLIYELKLSYYDIEDLMLEDTQHKIYENKYNLAMKLKEDEGKNGD